MTNYLDNFNNMYIGGALNNIKGLSKFNIFIVIMLIVTLLSITYYFRKSLFKTGFYKENSEKNTMNSKNFADLMFFYVDWCPHCKTAKPVWDEMKAEYENKQINGYQINFIDINCTKESAEIEQLVEKYNIEGYPTIKLVKDNQVIEYDAKPKKETIEEFLNTVI